MATLIERTTLFSGALSDLRNLRQAGTNADVFATRARLLRKPLEDVKLLVPVLRLMRAHGLDLEGEGAVPDQLLNEARQFASDYAADQHSAVGADAERNARFWTPLKAYAGRLEAALRRAWSAHVSNVVVPPPAALLDILQHVPGFSAAVAEVRRLMAEAESRSRSLPRGEEDFSEVEALAMALRSAWGVVGAETLPPEVVAFLRAAGIGDARLTHLTPAVLAWIGSHPGLGATLRISFARNGR